VVLQQVAIRLKGINNMGLFYKASKKQLLEARNKIYLTVGIPALKNKGFEELPFRTPWFGKNNLGDYTYELCRLNERNELEMITAHITKGDSWIKIYLNIFKLVPELKKLDQLKGLPLIQFYLPPNKLTEMRLRIDDFEGMPLFRKVEYKIKSYYTESGFQERVDELSKLIESDLNNIDYFIKRWHELHTPMVTDWEGKMIK
jgi:hypothetical protein